LYMGYNFSSDFWVKFFPSIKNCRTIRDFTFVKMRNRLH
jgi:hypothetical protein